MIFGPEETGCLSAIFCIGIGGVRPINPVDDAGMAYWMI
jgi:hypothetical protein